MTFETFDQSDEETWPDQQKDKDKYKNHREELHNDSSKRLVMFETFYPLTKKDNYKDLLENTLQDWQNIIR